MVPFGSLGDVTSARIGTSKATNKNKPIIIDSDEDVNGIEFGYHMWWESISLKKFENLINKNISDKTKHLHTYPNEELPDWHLKIPFFIGEGTGQLFNLPLPLPEYYEDAYKSEDISINSELIILKTKNLIESASLVHKMKLQALENLNSMSTFHIASVEKQPELSEHYPDARDGFYRRSSAIFTDKFMREGLPFGQFAWNQNIPRIPEDSKTKNVNPNYSNEWNWGVNFRDKVYEKDEISLIPFPALSKEEYDLYYSLARHLAPWESPILDEKIEKILKEKIEPKLQSFQNELSQIIQKKKNINSSSSSIKQNFIELPCDVHLNYRAALFFTGKLTNGKSLRQQILFDIQNNDNIIDAQTYFEPITNDILNVRITVSVLISKNEINSSFPKEKTESLENSFAKLNLKKIQEFPIIEKRFIHKDDSSQEHLVLHFKNKKISSAFDDGFNQKDPSLFHSIRERKAYQHGLKMAENFKSISK